MQNRVSIRFYEELNDFLEPEKRKKEFEVSIQGVSSIKALIGSLGVPPADVDLILVNGHSVAFSYVPQGSDRISVYPMFEAFDISKVSRLRAKPLRSPKFILDTDLGELAAHLSAFGFDVLYKKDFKRQDIIDRSIAQKRTILTQSRSLLLRKGVVRGYRLKQTQPQKQFDEVMDRFDLK